ncbi:hypothetical protein Pla144_32540 [Bythopirellula polymerisocia]|uniref:Uncharacterized protein n=1 Tax=Bythopirellula polymerisocia TaxID=2528003 RepID=A0A5C6CR75_9BACT|nr:hypothetical protein Pla144_32540 [Bythopirellula polymerisocia]
MRCQTSAWQKEGLERLDREETKAILLRKGSIPSEQPSQHEQSEIQPHNFKAMKNLHDGETSQDARSGGIPVVLERNVAHGVGQEDHDKDQASGHWS